MPYLDLVKDNVDRSTIWQRLKNWRYELALWALAGRPLVANLFISAPQNALEAFYLEDVYVAHCNFDFQSDARVIAGKQSKAAALDHWKDAQQRKGVA